MRHEEIVWLQQDGAPPHYAIQVRRYLNESAFPNRRRSLDLNPLNLFCGAISKMLFIELNVNQLKT